MRTWLSFYVYDSEKGDSMLPEKVRDFIKEKGLLARGDRVAVALSGGADSVCLLRILAGLSVLLKLFWITCPKWLSSAIYLLMGWLCIFSLKFISLPLYHFIIRQLFY